MRARRTPTKTRSPSVPTSPLRSSGGPIRRWSQGPTIPPRVTNRQTFTIHILLACPTNHRRSTILLYNATSGHCRFAIMPYLFRVCTRILFPLPTRFGGSEGSGFSPADTDISTVMSERSWRGYVPLHFRSSFPSAFDEYTCIQAIETASQMAHKQRPCDHSQVLHITILSHFHAISALSQSLA